MTADFLVYATLLLVAAIVAVRMVQDCHLRRKLGPYAELMSPECQVWLDALTRSVETDRVILEGCTREAFDLWGTDLEAARKRLALACEYVERLAVPDMIETVQVLRRLARTVAVLPPPRPLAAAAARLWHTRGLAAVATLLYWLGVTGKDRVRVRLWFVKRAFLAAARVFTRTAAVAERAGLGLELYTTLDEALDDMKLLRHDTVVTAELVLTAFSRWQAAHALPGEALPGA